MITIRHWKKYKWVLSKYPKTPEGREAQNGVKEIYTDKGDAQGYLDFVKNTPTINVTDAVKDSVMYLAAETRYSKSDCAGSIKEFSAYLSAFPDGAFALPAHFYRAECLFRQNDFDPALKDYEFVADQLQSRFSEKALLNAARISYVEKKDYTKAYRYYKALSENAEFKSNNLEASKGMMYTAFYLEQFDNATAAARKVLAAGNAGSDDIAEAHYYLAKIGLSQNDLSRAFDEFSIVSKQKSAFGAESAYEMANIYFRQNNLKSAEEQCYAVIKQKSGYNYWIANLTCCLLMYSMRRKTTSRQGLRYKVSSIIIREQMRLFRWQRASLEKVTAKELNHSKLKQENDDEMELDSIPPVH
jgi:tetratricopeptide (TPR) repeat protein